MTMQTQSKNPNHDVLLYFWISPFDRIPIKLEDLFRSLLTDCDALLQLCRKKTHLCHCLVENSSRLWNTHTHTHTQVPMYHQHKHSNESHASELTSWTENEPEVDAIKTLSGIHFFLRNYFSDQALTSFFLSQWRPSVLRMKNTLVSSTFFFL